MKSIIQGKNLKTTYGVDYKWKTIKDDKNEDITVYTGKPELTNKTEITSWETIAEFDETIEYNSNSFSAAINLSETEVVSVLNKIFRVDLGSYILRTNKILNDKVVLKEESEEILECQIKAFNKMMIKSNDGLLAYCKLHKLILEETDVDELFKVVYPNQTYRIEDGNLIVNNTMTINSSGITFVNGSTITPIYTCADGWATTTAITSSKAYQL